MLSPRIRHRLGLDTQCRVASHGLTLYRQSSGQFFRPGFLALGERIHRLEYRIGQRQSPGQLKGVRWRSEEHTSELQSLMRISYAVFCLKTKKYKTYNRKNIHNK